MPLESRKSLSILFAFVSIGISLVAIDAVRIHHATLSRGAGPAVSSDTPYPVAPGMRPEGPPAGGVVSAGSLHQARPGDVAESVPVDPEGVLRNLQAEERLLENEELVVSGYGPQAAIPITAAVLVIPVQFTATETLEYLVHDEEGKECISATGAFTGPLHGEIGYPGGSVSETIDNHTVFYSSTEPEVYEKLIFGRSGLTTSQRAGDPNINDGAGADLSGLTVQSYFDDQSDDTVEITGTVAPWVSVPHSEAYYGIDECVPNLASRAKPDEQLGKFDDLVVQSIERLKARGGVYSTYEFWKGFDLNSDSFVDSLWMIHSGRGQEYGGGAQGETALWSRASALMAYDGYPMGYVVHDNDNSNPGDDVRIGPFTILPEDSDIGVFIEEFGHSYFDLPDLYTTDASNSIGWWAPMSAGIYGGELAGTRPVNMPLWFRQVADCNGEPCGWADPVKVITYTTPGETVVLGQAGDPAGWTVPDGAYAGEIVHEGLRIDLPDQVDQAPNLAGDGGGAYSGVEAGQHNTLARELDLAGVSAPITVSFSSFWDIPYIFGYGYFEVAADGGEFATLPDLDGRFTDEAPMGVNDGWGLTRDGEGELRFDLSEYAGKSITFRLRYFTYQGTPDTGWWVDDLEVRSGEGNQTETVLRDDFESGLDGWDTVGWKEVPFELRYGHYYLVEWRNDTGFDESLRTVPSTSYSGPLGRRVDRVPANVPGALVTYRNIKYPLAGQMLDRLTDPPSIGPKSGLLVVDTSFWPVIASTGLTLTGSLQSLDGALALQKQADYTIESRDWATGSLRETETITGSAGVRRLDDALGYFPGFVAASASPMTAALWDEDASVVLPSRDGELYSTRVTWPDKSRPHPLDGVPVGSGHFLGSGNPGDANAQWGVHVEVLDKAQDGSWGAVRVYNAAVDYELIASALALPGRTSSFDAVMENRGAVTTTVTCTVTLPAELGVSEGPTSWSGDLAPGLTEVFSVAVRIPALWPPQAYRASAVFHDGTDEWERSAVMEPASQVFVPSAVKKPVEPVQPEEPEEPEEPE